MTLIKTGGSITNIVGRFSGNSFTRDKSGLHMNSQPRYITRQKSSQVLQRKAFAKASKFWADHITAEQKVLWKNYAHRHPNKNKLGETIVLTAFSSFMTINILRCLNNLQPISVPPVF